VVRPREASAIADPSPLLVLEARILRRGIADSLDHPWVDRLLPPPQPDQLDLEPPLVAVIEEEEHLLAKLGKGGAQLGPPDAPHALVGLAQIGEQLLPLLGIVITMAKAAVEAEGVVEVEAKASTMALARSSRDPPLGSSMSR
jgi:hypothetical protein